MSWTDGRIEILRTMWSEKRSAGEIAIVLGAGITRNAVIGKITRLGLTGMGGEPYRSPPVRVAAAPKAEPISPRYSPDPALVRAKRPPQLIEKIVAPDDSLRVTIADLKGSMCRWPLGDPSSDDFRYCGSPARHGAYCAFHGAIAYTPVATIRKQNDQRRGALRAW